MVITSTLMLEAEKKITRKKSKTAFRDLDKALVGFAKIADKNFKNLMIRWMKILIVKNSRFGPYRPDANTTRSIIAMIISFSLRCT